MQHTRGTYRQYRDEVLTAITTLHVATIEEYAEAFTGQGYTVAWNSDRHEAGFTARVTVYGREEVVSFVPVAPEEEGMDPWALLESSKREGLAEAKGYADGIAAQRLLAEKSAKDSLESMIDSSSLSDVLSLLAEVCGDKASHLSENWQDANAAKVWERSAARIVTACNRVHEYGL